MHIHRLKSFVAVILLAVVASPVMAAGRGARVRLSEAGRTPRQETTEDRGSISAPVLGLFANEDGKEVRAIVGVPGAALVSDLLALPEGVDRIYLAPSQRWGLVQKPEGAGLAVLAFEGATAGTLADVTDSLPSINLARFSPMGRIGIAYSRSADRLQVITTQVTMSISTADLFPAGVKSIAIDDAGNAPVVVTEDGGVYLVHPDAGPDLVFQGQNLSDVVYAPNQNALFIADSTLSQIVMVESPGANQSARTVASDLTKQDSHISLQVSEDGRSMFAVAAESKSGWKIDLASSATQVIGLPSTPLGLERLRSGNMFLFSAAVDEPVWALSGDDTDLRAVFVPRPAAEAAKPVGEESEIR